jgi:hypothetical protein
MQNRRIAKALRQEINELLHKPAERLFKPGACDVSGDIEDN